MHAGAQDLVGLRRRIGELCEGEGGLHRSHSRPHAPGAEHAGGSTLPCALVNAASPPLRRERTDRARNAAGARISVAWPPHAATAPCGAAPASSLGASAATRARAQSWRIRRRRRDQPRRRGALRQRRVRLTAARRPAAGLKRRRRGSRATGARLRASGCSVPNGLNSSRAPCGGDRRRDALKPAKPSLRPIADRRDAHRDLGGRHARPGRRDELMAAVMASPARAASGQHQHARLGLGAQQRLDRPSVMAATCPGARQELAGRSR
jgi:hypothetical protein